MNGNQSAVRYSRLGNATTSGNGEDAVNREDKDNFAVRMIKRAFHAIFMWFFSAYNCFLYVTKKQYRMVRKHQVVKYDLVALSPLTDQRLSMFY
ncbi:SCPL-2 protein [Ditylenchus destructor]|uniref:SCPL-2 protein n=1 Tax=Ditylenchus destructor TaxID=166010 RepID=A0AAD4MHL4_9BILA|nr:SCPL-2 protein [Ditylenchus destructor]